MMADAEKVYLCCTPHGDVGSAIIVKAVYSQRHVAEAWRDGAHAGHIGAAVIEVPRNAGPVELYTLYAEAKAAERGETDAS